MNYISGGVKTSEKNEFTPIARHEFTPISCNNFKGLSKSELIGGPLKSSADAQIKLADTSDNCDN